jgi:hypothetical protein
MNYMFFQMYRDMFVLVASKNISWKGTNSTIEQKEKEGTIVIYNETSCKTSFPHYDEYEDMFKMYKDETRRPTFTIETS